MFQEIMVGPQYQATVPILHLNRHGEKGKNLLSVPCLDGGLLYLGGLHWEVVSDNQGGTSSSLWSF